MTTPRRTLIALVTALALTALATPAQAGLLGAATEPLLAAPPPAGTLELGGVHCNLIAVPAATPVGISPCPGVRPGATVLSDGGQCTFNYLFRATDGTRYIGTAGHCILGDSPIGGDAGERTWAPGSGPVARDGSGARVGEFAYAVLQSPRDFALIRLDPGVDADPQMCHFGGPTGLNDDRPGLFEPTVLEHHGNGVAIGTVLPARSAVALGMPDPDHVFAQGVALPGDSGSAINSADGRAVGVIVTVGIHSSGLGTTGVDAGVVGITRLAPQVERAADQLGTDLTLVTAPKL